MRTQEGGLSLSLKMDVDVVMSKVRRHLSTDISGFLLDLSIFLEGQTSGSIHKMQVLYQSHDEIDISRGYCLPKK